MTYSLLSVKKNHPFFSLEKIGFLDFTFTKIIRIGIRLLFYSIFTGSVFFFSDRPWRQAYVVCGITCGSVKQFCLHWSLIWSHVTRSPRICPDMWRRGCFGIFFWRVHRKKGDRYSMLGWFHIDTRCQTRTFSWKKFLSKKNAGSIVFEMNFFEMFEMIWWK